MKKVYIVLWLLLLLISCKDEKRIEMNVDSEESLDSEIAAGIAGIDLTESTPETEVETLSGVSNTSLLNVRELPSRDSNKIGELKEFEEVEVLFRTSRTDNINGFESYWLKIRTDEIEGWVYGLFIRLEEGYEIENVIAKSVEIHDSVIISYDLSNIISEFLSQETLQTEMNPFDDYPESRVPLLGYSHYEGKYLWIIDEVLYGFNGVIIELFDLSTIEPIRGLTGGVIPKVFDNSIYIYATSFRNMWVSEMAPGYFLDLTNGMITIDNTGESILDIKRENQGILPIIDSITMFDGYHKIINDEIYGCFGNNEGGLNIFKTNGRETLLIGEIQEGYRGYDSSIVDERTIKFYRPVDGWNDEDTDFTAQFEYIIVDFTTNEILSEYVE